MSNGILQVAAHAFACAMARLDGAAAARVAALAARIPAGALAGPGREAMPHVTVRWGLDDGDAPAVAAAVAGWRGPARIRLGRTSSWETPDGDCVKIDVTSPDLADLRRLIEAACPAAADTFPFDPHITLAYVAAGRGAEFAGWDDLAGVVLEFPELVLGLTDDAIVPLPLGGLVAASGFDPSQPREENGRWVALLAGLPKLADGSLSAAQILGREEAVFHAFPDEGEVEVPLGDQRVRIDELVPTQDEVDPRTVRGYMQDPEHPAIDVYERGGRRFIADGHHRVIAAKLRGDTTIAATLTRIERTRLVGASGFDPNQPRDDNGRWRSVSATPDLLAIAFKDSQTRSLPRSDMENDVYGIVVGGERRLDYALNRFDQDTAEGRQEPWGYSEETVAKQWAATREHLRKTYGDQLILFRADAPEKEHSEKTRTVYMGGRGLVRKFANNGRKMRPYRVKTDDVLAVFVPNDPAGRKHPYYEFIVKRPKTGLIRHMAFDPNQPRDDAGRWVDTGTGDPDAHEAAINRWIEAAAAEMPKLDLTERKRDGLLARDELYRGDTQLIGGLAVRTRIPNTDSISATLNDGDYEELPGIRAVPLASLGLADYRAADDRARVDALAERIKDSGEISPLIVVRDHEGNYTLEGNHRARALQRLGHTHAPALVIIEYPAMKPRALVELVGAEFDPNQPRDENGRWTDGSGAVIVDKRVSPEEGQAFLSAVDALPDKVKRGLKSKIIQLVPSVEEFGHAHSAGEVFGATGDAGILVKAHPGAKTVLYHEIGHGETKQLARRPAFLEAFGRDTQKAHRGQLGYYASSPEEAYAQSFAYHMGGDDENRAKFEKAFKNTHATLGAHLTKMGKAAVRGLADGDLPSRYRLSKFAAEHAAELVQAPRRVRTLIRNEVRKALRNGEGPEGIADRLDGLVAMEPARIDTIARTEYAIARTGARLEEAATLYGDVEVVKGWVLGDESCPRCIALAGMEVPIDEDFVAEDGERVAGPPLHPNCDCDIEIREVAERERLRAAVRLVGAYDPDQPRDANGRWTTAPCARATRIPKAC